ncbi:uncharacterized protein LOC125502349 [Dendroctonus ponderosae]|uniref:uncharacterized protein LOC125502349 n=1 Tax=Dendroctonus ponderosae TaxID=77166 RepID=UPI002036162F|nr:uncharacterized protein LOC125502349 [Dendroctonus ponderosae]
MTTITAWVLISKTLLCSFCETSFWYQRKALFLVSVGAWCRLPRNENLRSIWIRRARCEDLVAKLKFRSVFMCSRHFHVVCFKANGRFLLNCLPTKYLPGFQGAPSIENSFYRESIPSARGCVTPEKNQDGVCMVESNTILTHTSPLESVIKPAKVYPGKRRLVQPIAEISPQFRAPKTLFPGRAAQITQLEWHLNYVHRKNEIYI